MTKIMKKMIAILAAALMVFTAMPLTAFADGGIEYIDRTGGIASTETYTGSYTTVTSSTTSWSSGWYFVDSAVTISSVVNVSGDVRLILGNNADLKCEDGIRVNGKTTSLKIYAQEGDLGKLTATTETDNCAGIGGGDLTQSGVISIFGGNITATADSDAAGIGGGNQSDAGTVYIFGGTINATGGSRGAGIGGGDQSTNHRIYISGGDITATGGYDAAGIGGGDCSYPGTIEIDRANITATGGESGAGIGGGNDCAGGNIEFGSRCGTIIATGGTDAAGIGGGEDAADGGGNITIRGGNITATGSACGAGIGGGNNGATGNITIYNGTITTTGGGDALGAGAGIGSGSCGDYGTIIIYNGTVTATGGSGTSKELGAAGIGAGCNYNFKGSDNNGCGTITIYDGNITANGTDSAAGIGSAYYSRYSGTITINGGTVTANGGKYGAGIGSGVNKKGEGVLNSIEINDGTVTATGGVSGSGIGTGVSYDGGEAVTIAVTINGGTVIATGGGAIYDRNWRCPGTGIGAGGKEDDTNHPSSYTHFRGTININGGDVTAIAGGFPSNPGEGSYSDITDKAVAIGGYHHTNSTINISGGTIEARPAVYNNTNSSAAFATDALKFCDSGENGIQVIKSTVTQANQVAAGSRASYCTAVSSKVVVQPCPHDDIASYSPNKTDDDTHILTCTYCTASLEPEAHEYELKSWNWNASGTAATATFVCTDCQYETTVTDVEMTADKHRTTITYTASVTFGGDTYTDTNEVDKPLLTITVNPSEHGIVTASENTAYEDDEITLMVRPERGYALDTLTVNGVSVTNKRFTMPAENATINATFVMRPMHTVTWVVNGEVVEIDTDAVEGTQPEYNGETPAPYSDASMHYIFIGWNDGTRPYFADELPDVSGDVTYTAVYTSNYHTYGTPVWTWAENKRSATATFTCTNNHCGYEKTVDATISGENQGSKRVFTATVELGGNTYTDTAEVDRTLCSVTITPSDNGTVTPSAESAYDGDYVTLTVTPDAGYALKSISVTKENGYTVYFTDLRNHVFQMPDSNVTVTAVFEAAQYVEQVEPYIDENGAYIAGVVEHYTASNGYNYAVNEDGTVGERLTSVELTYFEFEYLYEGAYKVKAYTGPTEGITEIVIPKSYNGYNVTKVGYGNGNNPFCSLETPFTLVLNENVEVIEEYAFAGSTITRVTGDTSGLKTINRYAFSNANGDNNHSIEIDLSYSGTVRFNRYSIQNMNVTLNLTHSTVLDLYLTYEASVAYNFTDAHTYGEPEWSWNDDHSIGKATCTCTGNELCNAAQTTTYTYVAAAEPYIDENGAYILGCAEHYVDGDGVCYAINDDLSVGDVLESVDTISYFEFALMSGGTYTLNHYTGPMDITELVIPKTYNGIAITQIGSGNSQDKFITSDDTSTYKLVLNENITKIAKYAFWSKHVSEVIGNTSSLNYIDDYAFSWANSDNDYNISVKLDYEGEVNCYIGAFNHINNVTFNLKHATRVNIRGTNSGNKPNSVTYNFTDAHVYGEPTWSWADDCSAAIATFTCTDSRCNHQETVNASIVKGDDGRTYTATATFNSTEYSNVKVKEQASNGSNLELADKINTTVYIDADYYGADTATAVVKATYNHNSADSKKEVRTDTIPLGELEQYEGNNKYKGAYMFTYSCAPAQLTEQCKIELYANADDEEEPLFTQTFSAKEYCDTVNRIYDESDKPDASLIKLNALCNSLVDYAKASQIQFAYSEDLTEDYRDGRVLTLNADEIEATANVKTEDVYGFAFDCQDELNMLVYTNKQVQPTGVSCNATMHKDGISASHEVKNSTNYIRVKGLGSGNINKVVTIETASGNIVVGANAISKAYVGADGVSENMKNLARAIYLYGIAAANYFGS